MDLERARYLVSPAGQEALATLRHEALPAGVVARSAFLRKRFAPHEASALAEQLTLAERARDRFGELAPPRWLYTDAGLQMMTHPLVARRRTARIAASGLDAVDLTAGLGGELGPLVTAGVPAVGFDRDPVTALLARHNVGIDAHILRADATAPPVDLSTRAVILDPSRRTNSSRRFDPTAFSPPWDRCLELAASGRLAVIKTAPGIDDMHIPPEAEIEFVQLGRSLREAALWFGKGTEPGLRRAVVLPGDHMLTSLDPEGDTGTCSPRRYLIDPAGCVTRGGLVRQLAAQLNATLIDEHIGYITTDQPSTTPFATTFEVLEQVPFSVARLRKLLHERGWRPDEIRRRGFPVEPDELRRLLRPRGDTPVALICTTIGRERTVFVCRPAQLDGTAGQ